MKYKFCVTCGYDFDDEESFWECVQLPIGDLPVIGDKLCPKCCPKDWKPQAYPGYLVRMTSNLGDDE